MAFIGFDNFPNFFMNILIFAGLGDIFWFCFTTFFNKSFYKLSFTSYNFVSFNKCNIFVLQKSFFCQKWLDESPKVFICDNARFSNVIDGYMIFWFSFLVRLVRRTGFVVIYKPLCFFRQDFCSFYFSIYFQCKLLLGILKS